MHERFIKAVGSLEHSAQPTPLLTHARITSPEVEAQFPKFTRVVLSDLEGAASRAERSASIVRGIQGYVGAATVGVCGGIGIVVANAVSHFVTNASVELGTFIAFGVVGLLTGAVFRSNVEQLFDKPIKNILRPSELLTEAKSHGLVCNSCSYPIVDLAHCPECGPQNERQN